MRTSAGFILALLLTGCGGSERALVTDLSTNQELSLYKLQSVDGKRDGAWLAAHALISDSSSLLSLDLHFMIGSPTVLRTGTWQWRRTGQILQGRVRAQSVTFLGGQDGPPSVGGSFQLLDMQGTPLYHVALPVRELKATYGR